MFEVIPHCTFDLHFSNKSKISADGDCNHEIERRLLLGRKVMTNVDSILKSRDIILSTKVRLLLLLLLSHFSRVRLCATLWIVVPQVPLFTVFSKQEYWSGLPRLPSGDLLNSGTEPVSLTTPALAGKFFTTSTIWEIVGVLKK